MRGGERKGRARIATVLGVAIAVGALLVLAIVPAASSAVRLERPALPATADPTCFTGDTPRDPGYDPVTHEMFVPNEGYPGQAGGAPNISVFSGTCTLVKTISLPTGAIPIQAAFDPSDNDMYVTDYGLNVVYVITGNKINTTISGFDEPMGIAYDAYQPAMVVVNSGDDRVDWIVGSTNAGVFFYTGSDPYGIAFDPSCVCDLVTNTGSDTVTTYDDVSFATFTQAVGVSPRGIAYNPVNSLDYVANSGSNNVSVLMDGGLYYTLSGFDGPYGVAWDQSTLTIWVTNDVNGKAYEIGGDLGLSFTIVKKFSTASDSHALGLAYDEYNDEMYVTGFDTDVVYVL